MKKFLLVALLCLSTPALAQSQPDAGGSGQNFAQAKAKILAKMQERQACVQAANDPQALRACLPNMGQHGGGRRGGPPGADAPPAGDLPQ